MKTSTILLCFLISIIGIFTSRFYKWLIPGIGGKIMSFCINVVVVVFAILGLYCLYLKVVGK